MVHPLNNRVMYRVFRVNKAACMHVALLNSIIIKLRMELTREKNNPLAKINYYIYSILEICRM